MNLKDTLLFKKAFGCLIGGAIGDAFGGPLETMNYQFIRQYHNGRVTDLIDYRRPEDFFQPSKNSAYAWSDRAGTFTDDTYFQLLITKAIVKKGGRITCDDLLEMWMEDCNINRGWDTLRNSYSKIVNTRIPARELGVGNIAENSPAMCIGTIGAVNAGNPAQAALDAYDVVSLHHDGYAREAACMIAAAVAEAMKPDTSVENVVDAAVRYLPNRKDSKMYAPMRKAIELADKAADTEELTKMFYDQLIVKWDKRGAGLDDDERKSFSIEPLESIPCAIAMFYKEKGDYKKSIIASANFGRDCDTIACMTGYIAGAFNGTDGIPAEWIGKSLSANPDSNMEELGVGLTKAILQEKERMDAMSGMIDHMLHS